VRVFRAIHFFCHLSIPRGQFSCIFSSKHQHLSYLVRYNLSYTSDIPLLTASGIGLAAAQILLTSPANHKLIVISRTHEALDQLHSQYPSQVEVLAGDLSDLSLKLPEKAVELAISRWGKLDALIVNHGTLDPVARIADVKLEDWEKGFRANVTSAVGLVC
jgi:NAD(P)-dependent dehydrogenase (short-subunit alcohol dehydrogenase family)